MQHMYFDGCSGLTGKAKGEVTSEGHTVQVAAHRPSFLTVSFFFIFTPPLYRR